MKALIFITLLFAVVTCTYSQNTQDQVRGLVTDLNKNRLLQANIIIKHTNKGTSTDRLGRYELNASVGDTLLFTYLGKQPYQIVVREIPSKINVSLQSSNIQLEAVEIKARRLPTPTSLLKEYPGNKNLIKTSWGILDKDMISGSMRIIDGNNLINVGTDFLTSLKGLVPNMVVIRGWEGVRVSFIGGGQAIFDVDGLIQETPPTYLSSSEIDRVAVLQRFSAMMQYGPRGAGGVIIINTKGQTAMDELGVDRSYENQILLDSMILEATNHLAYVPFTSPYLNPLKKIKNSKKALAIHEAQKQKYLDNPYYYLEVYDFLSTRWKNSKEGIKLYKEILDRFPNNVEALKALAYLQAQYGNYKNALSLYLKILAQKTDQAQAHRDVGNAYVESGDSKKALNRYTGFGKYSSLLTKIPFDAQGEDLLVTTEIMNILKQNGEELLDSFDHKEVHTVYEGTRLVFDWNNPSAKFDLQIISPDGYYDTWQNYIEEEAEMVSPSERRYYCKQFFIDEEIKGKWSINLNYQGNQSDYPTYLKLSVYRDYGLPSQSLKIRVYRLSEKNNKINLYQLNQK